MGDRRLCMFSDCFLKSQITLKNRISAAIVIYLTRCVAISEINEEEESEDEDYDPAQDEEVSSCPSTPIQIIVGKSNIR